MHARGGGGAPLLAWRLWQARPGAQPACLPYGGAHPHQHGAAPPAWACLGAWRCAPAPPGCSASAPAWIAGEQSGRGCPGWLAAATNGGRHAGALLAAALAWRAAGKASRRASAVRRKAGRRRVHGRQVLAGMAVLAARAAGRQVASWPFFIRGSGAGAGPQLTRPPAPVHWLPAAGTTRRAQAW
jgi:hypothetical protein